MSESWREMEAGHAYLAAYKAREDATAALVEATRRAFPIGTRVMSQQRHGVVIEGEVVGVSEYSGDVGCVVVRNLRTGKSHRACPFSKYSHFEVVPGPTVRAASAKATDASLPHQPAKDQTP